MLPAPRSRRLYWILGTLLLAVSLGMAARLWLGGYVVRSVLRMAGASEIRHGAVRGTPWLLEVEELRFKVRTHAFFARRVTLARRQWWLASLGDVRVEQARMPVVLDGSDVDPWNWSTYERGGWEGEPVSLPFRSLVLAGELVVRMATVPDRAIAIQLEGQPRSGTSWVGSLVAEGEGFHLAGAGSLLRAGQELDFQVHSAALDLGLWSRQVQRLVSLPGGPWTMQGRLTGVAEGKVTAQRFAATARVRLADGSMRAGTRDIEARGAEAELEFSDLWKLRTKSGALHLDELRVGRLVVQDVAADFGLWGGSQIEIQRTSGTALGGKLTVDPFRYSLNQSVVNLMVRPERVRAPGLIALTQGVAPRLSGEIDGEVALRIQGDGVHVAGGSLVMRPERAPELQVNAAAMLRSGAIMDAGTTEVFRGARGGSVLIRLDEMRFEPRGEGLPLGTSARVRVAGRVDGAPVAFTYHVNGALERFLSL